MTAPELTAAVAKKFLKNPEAVDLDEFTALDPQAAALLSASTVDLCLNGLEEISEDAAKALVPHSGAISLEGLVRLSFPAAQALAQHMGPLRGVDLLRFVGDYPTFSVLRRHPSLVSQLLEDSLFIEILRSKDIDLMCSDGSGFPFADRVSRRYFERGFGYDGIPIDDGIAFVLQAEGRPLWRVELPDPSEKRPTAGAGEHVLYFFGDREDVLRRLADLPNRVLTEEIATQWAEDSHSVDLSAYGDISVDAAKVLLARGTGPLELDGLRTISEKAVTFLAMYQGDLSLCGLAVLSDGAAAALAKHRGAPSPHNCLTLLGLEKVSDAAAEALSKHQGGGLILGFKTLSDAAAKALAQYPGELVLDRLDTLSESAADELSKRDSSLDLDGLTTLSGKAARILAANPKIRLPDPIRKSL